MSTKYSVPNRTRWQWKGFPRVTDHCLDRWDERTPADSVSPETAFKKSVDVSKVKTLFEDNTGQIPDEARYWYERTETEAYGIVFIVKHEVVKTVYKWSYISDEPTKAYLQAHNGEFV